MIGLPSRAVHLNDRVASSPCLQPKQLFLFTCFHGVSHNKIEIDLRTYLSEHGDVFGDWTVGLQAAHTEQITASSIRWVTYRLFFHVLRDAYLVNSTVRVLSVL